jgi:hypothetical protein
LIWTRPTNLTKLNSTISSPKTLSRPNAIRRPIVSDLVDVDFLRLVIAVSWEVKAEFWSFNHDRTATIGSLPCAAADDDGRGGSPVDAVHVLGLNVGIVAVVAESIEVGIFIERRNDRRRRRRRYLHSTTCTVRSRRTTYSPLFVLVVVPYSIATTDTPTAAAAESSRPAFTSHSTYVIFGSITRDGRDDFLSWFAPSSFAWVWVWVWVFAARRRRGASVADERRQSRSLGSYSRKTHLAVRKQLDR